MAVTTIGAITLMAMMTAASIGQSVHQGEQQKKGQKKARQAQESAQNQALSSAASDRREEGLANRNANKESMRGLDSIVRAARRSTRRNRTDLTGGGAPGTGLKLGD